METSPQTQPDQPSLEALVAHLSGLQASHTRQLEECSRKITALERDNAKLRSALVPAASRRYEAPQRRTPTPRMSPGTGTSRRGLLRLGGAAAAAGVAAVAANAATGAGIAHANGVTWQTGTVNADNQTTVVPTAGFSDPNVLSIQIGTGTPSAPGSGSAIVAYDTTPKMTPYVGTGIALYASSNNGTGIWGNADIGTGVYGTSNSGWGMYGYGLGCPGIGANSQSDVAIWATTGPMFPSSSKWGAPGLPHVDHNSCCTYSAKPAIIAQSYSNDGVQGMTATSTAHGLTGVNVSNTNGSVAVLGHSDDGSGGLGPGVGVRGETAGGVGVVGSATTGVGVSGTSASGTGTAISGAGTNGATGLSATSDTGMALQALSSGTGVATLYSANVGNGTGVQGVSQNGGSGLGSGTGVGGASGSGTGVFGTATNGVGVYGSSAGGASKQALQGVGTSGAAGLRATSDTGNGIVALSTSGTGLNVQSASGSAVVATSNGVGYGLYLTAPSGWAIGCVGRIRVLGNAVGTVTLKAGTTSKTVNTSACSSSSQVILTATTDPQVRIWTTVAAGAFTVNASAAPSADVTFSYLLIN